MAKKFFKHFHPVSGSEKGRNWEFIVYPDSCDPDWINILNDLKLTWCHSPLHDKDRKDPDHDYDYDGDFKKAHYHCIITFGGPKTAGDVSEILDMISVPVPKFIEHFRVSNMYGAVPYFVHFYNDDKYHYKKEDIVSFGVPIDSYFVQVFDTDLKIYDEIFDWIDDNSVLYFRSLLQYARSFRRDDWYPLLLKGSCYIFKEYIYSVRQEYKDLKSGLSD